MNTFRTGWNQYWSGVSGQYGWKQWFGFCAASTASIVLYSFLKAIALDVWGLFR
jgi:hypothetical protein